MKKLMTLGAVWVVLQACTQAPAMKVYTLKTPPVREVSKLHYAQRVLQVAYPQSVREDFSQNMHFSYSQSDYGSYLNSQWSNDTGTLLQGTLLDVLTKAHLFKAVVLQESEVHPHYRLESTLFEMEHRVRGDASYATLTLTLTLLNTQSGSMIKSKRFSYTKATPTTDAKGYATATNAIMADLSKEMLLWL